MEAKTAHTSTNPLEKFSKSQTPKELLCFDCETPFIHKGLNNAAPACVNSGREVCTHRQEMQSGPP